jgi:G:T-mismatch repair DNA endonuclease (very short patch repair protein)
MGILRCDECGDDFVIYHSPAFVNKSVADRQAYWLEKVLAEEHERDKKHPDRIELPD